MKEEWKEKSNMEEIWKDIPGYEGLYRVSTMGRVLSLRRRIRIPANKMCHSGCYEKELSQRLLKQIPSQGYAQVFLRKNGKTHRLLVHRLVVEAFIRKPERGEDVNHKNGIRDDNRIENIELCSRSYNVWHGYHINGHDQWSSIKVMCLENGEIYSSYKDAARKLGLSDTLVAKVARGEHKQTKGYHFIKV